MKKQFMFLLLLALAITVGAGAVIYEQTVTHLNVWGNNTVAYKADVTDIDSIALREATGAGSANTLRVWVSNAVAYEADVAGIDSITFAIDSVPVTPPDTAPVIIPDTTKVDSITPIVPDTIPAVTPIPHPEGAVPGLFSVAEDKRVYFSKGNLQYVGTWQFAEHQWDYFGTDQSDGHRDLFGWGTGIAPNNVSTSVSDYSTFIDWGGNPISNGGNKGFLWETLTQKEYKYLFFTRENAETLFGFGKVNGINGLIVLPDNWTLPEGATFVASTTQGLTADGSSYSSSSSANNYSHNTYTVEQWAVMEAAGAVFLPAAGYRSNKTSVSGVANEGDYWSATSSASNTSTANYFNFTKQKLATASYYNRPYGRSVRLVQPEVLDTAQQQPIRGKFSIGEDKQVYFAPGNLQYKASTKTWRFAEHQYDTIGAGNANISDTYDGWIDLFGWGTGDKPTMRTSINDYYYYSYHDWGINPISYPGDTIDHQWRALTVDEWIYLYDKRPNYKNLSGHGIVNGMRGFIILPDDWKLPWGLVFDARTSSWDKNTYSLEQWEKMEAAGAIFLPAAGYRNITEVKRVGTRGSYWFSSIRTDLEMHSQCLDFYETNGSATSSPTAKIETSTSEASAGHAVRLIEPVVPEVAPADPEPIAHPEGAIAGLFSVSETKKVYFSQGNLQCSACGWTFAEHQWDMLGDENAASALDGTIDLFYWKSGSRPGDGGYEEIPTNVDWGMNAIVNGGNTPNTWHTLTSAEWEYLFDDRPNAGKLRSHGCVNGVNGYIFLPDDWQLPYGGRFFPNRGQWLGNVYTLEEWARMEAAGAVFLPAAGLRTKTEVSDVNKSGSYWSKTLNETYNTAGYFYFSWVQNLSNPNYLIQENQIQRVTSATPDYAKSVRLVQTAP